MIKDPEICINFSIFNRL